MISTYKTFPQSQRQQQARAYREQHEYAMPYSPTKLITGTVQLPRQTRGRESWVASV